MVTRMSSLFLRTLREDPADAEQIDAHTRAWAQAVNASGAADHGGDVVGDVHEVLAELVDKATAAGVDESQITLDPGLGFANNGRVRL